ncbi:hypothetical protein BJY00DRAFT_16126 [Aspergillus carlsbadensis]|nr:hypothetical protein BJY00DRAFT_16126 [Aspergillus carlsbadensis]
MLVTAIVCRGMNSLRALLASISDSSTPCACFGMLTISHPDPQALGLIILRHAFKSGPLLGCLLPTLRAGDCFCASPSNNCPASALFLRPLLCFYFAFPVSYHLLISSSHSLFLLYLKFLWMWGAVIRQHSPQTVASSR